MALVRCQPPDDLPAKHLFCCSGVSRTNVRKTQIWGESIKIGSPLFFLYRVKAYFKKQTRKGGFMMNNVDYKAMLYEKMNNEQNSYRKWLMSQQPAEILNHTYEYTTREDILMCMEELSLQPKQAKAMLKSPCPLKDVYEEFRDRETDYMDTIRESIEAEADRCIHKEKPRVSREDR